MIIRKLMDCEEFVAGDDTRLREMLHADKEIDGVKPSLGYSLAHASLAPGKSSYPHSLKTSEVYYILEGQGKMHIDDETANVDVGDTIYIPPQARQFITNTGDVVLKFICIVDPAWKAADEEIYSG